MKKIFETLNAVDVNKVTAKKNKLTYLPWAFAWAKVKEKYPDANYVIWKDERHKPYILDETLGYMVFTEVTIEGLTHECWLPVMNGANKAMKDKVYTYKVKDYQSKAEIEKKVEPATMIDINKTIMRCLVKNLAMFGLGLYIYAKEDLPIEIEIEQTTENFEKLLKNVTTVKELTVIYNKNINKIKNKSDFIEFCAKKKKELENDL